MRGHADLAGQQDVLAGLRHRAVRGAHHQDRAVHLRRTGDHVLHVVGVAGAVNVRVVALVALVFDVCGVDRDPALLLFRSRRRCPRMFVAFAFPDLASTVAIAAVSVDLPWSTWPMVPTLTCGLVLLNCSFAMLFGCCVRFGASACSVNGAHDQD